MSRLPVSARLRVPTRVCLLVTGLLLPTLPNPAAAQTTRPDQVVRTDTLPNGLTVIVVENHAVPLATAHVVFRGGAMTQTAELQGVPHLFEHMLFKGYQSSDGASFADDASRSKASYNGATSDEEVSYTLWFPSDELGGNLGLLATLVRDANFKDKDLQTERFVVRNEMQRSQSQPSYLLGDASRRALWGDWYARKNTIGTDLSLFTTNATKLKALYDIWYVPNNAALVVTGDVSADKVFGEARKHFGRWRRAADPIRANPVPVPPAMDSTFAFVYTHEVQTVTVQLSWRGPTFIREPDAIRDAATLPGLLNADESPFQRALVDGGLFQSASMSADLNQHGSSLHFTGTTTLDQLTNALGMLGTVIGNLGVEGYFDADMLKADARRDRVSWALAFEDTPSLASSLGSAWAVRRLKSYTQSDADTQSTPESLRAFANAWLINKPYVIGVLTPVGTEQAVGTTVAQFVSFMRQP
jgi:zinc protease